MLPAFIVTERKNKLFYGGALLIWAVCEFIVFQPNTYDNNKLLFVWFAMTCGIVSELIIKLGKSSPAPKREGVPASPCARRRSSASRRSSFR